MDWLRRIVSMIRRYRAIIIYALVYYLVHGGVDQLICTNIHYMKSEWCIQVSD